MTRTQSSSTFARAAATALVIAALCALNLFVYAQTLGFEVVDLDDSHYVADHNPHVPHGLTTAGIKWAMTTVVIGNWHPITWLSLMLDRTIEPEGWGVFHATNLLLHMLNTLLLLGVMRAMTGQLWPSALMAAIFAVHPLHVESVAWISERKDVLSTMFGLLAIWAYTRHARRADALSRGWLIAATVLLALGLMCKPMLVTLPFVLLLLDFWPLRRLRQTPLALVTEKIPMFVIIALACAMTWWAQSEGGAVQDDPLLSRLSNAAISYVRYIGLAVWPDGLAVHYPRPGSYEQPPWPLWIALLCAASLLAATLGFLALARRAPWAIVGWLWFVGTLVPVIGLVQVGAQAMADRYMYMPLIGLSMIVARSAWSATHERPTAAWIVGLVLAGCILGLAETARRQTVHWRNSDTLFPHALAVTDNNYRVHEIYGQHLLVVGRFAEAQQHFEQCMSIAPNTADARVWLARSLMAQEHWTAAERVLKEALTIDANHAEAHFRIGSLLLARDRRNEALPHLQAAARLEPRNDDYRMALKEAEIMREERARQGQQ